MVSGFGWFGQGTLWHPGPTSAWGPHIYLCPTWSWRLWLLGCICCWWFFCSSSRVVWGSSYWSSQSSRKLGWTLNFGRRKWTGRMSHLWCLAVCKQGFVGRELGRGKDTSWVEGKSQSPVSFMWDTALPVVLCTVGTHQLWPDGKGITLLNRDILLQVYTPFHFS